MNDLNSVLIEGRVKGEPKLSYSSHGTPICHFSIKSKRCHRVDDKYQEKVHTFDVVVVSQLAERCMEYLRKDKGIRIVGRLESDEDSIITIIQAEHVEFKPEPKKG